MKIDRKFKFLLPLMVCMILQILILSSLKIGSGVLSMSFQIVEEENNELEDKSNVKDIMSWGAMILITSVEIIICTVYIDKIEEENINNLDEFKEYNCNCSYVDIEDRTGEIFFKLQEAWTKRNINIAKDYVSENIYNSYKRKIEYMKEKHKTSVIEKIRLITTRSVGVIKYDYEKDYMWFYVEASMVNYKIDDITGEIVEGDRNRRKITEYWKVVQKGEEWVLDETVSKEQVDERKILSMVY